MLSKRDYKRKKKEEQEAAAYVFQDFIETFQNPTISVPNKAFVRTSVLLPNSQEKTNENERQIYKPTPIISQNKVSDINKAVECAKILKDNVMEKSKKQDKPKSNLDILKEELKLRHTERGEKDRLKEEYSLSPTSISFESEQLTTTNLFVANLNSKMTENHLMLEFGAYGPLASVKILWPRNDGNNRNTNCGFVAFMSRKDAERALRENQNRDDMRVCWGRSVELPSLPIYIPNCLLKLYLPPPLSGLPFNAQVSSNTEKINDKTKINDFNTFLSTCYIKVTIPLNKKVLAIVHRMIEFVVAEGPMFEAVIMNREINNPDYNFLFDCQSPIHIYYRWKLFSILNGDCQKSWSMKKFRMFKGGSIWCPPIAPCYSAGMPDELIYKTTENNKLTDSQLNRLISLIRSLTMQRSRVKEIMIFCMNHLAAIDDSIEIITDSLMNPETSPPKKIARLYLLSDLLTNCKSRRIKLQIENNEETLMKLFKGFQNTVENLKCFSDIDNFNSRVIRVIRHWDIYKIFNEDFVETINAMFSVNKNTEDEDNSSMDEPLDGANLLKRSNLESMDPNVITVENFNAKKNKELSTTEITKYFVPSKWDTVDPEEVEAQAMSTEKMYLMEMGKDVKKSNSSRTSNGKKKKKKSRH